MQRKSLYVPALVFVLSVVLLFLLPRLLDQEWFLERYAEALGEQLQGWEEELAEVAMQREVLMRLVGNEGHRSASPEDFLVFQRLTSQPWSVHFYRGDSLVLWGRPATVLPDSIRSRLAVTDRGRLLARLSNGWYLIHKWRIDTSAQLDLYALLPVRHEFPLQSAYLQNGFPAVPCIPSVVQVSLQPPGKPVYVGGGQPVCYLSADQPFRDRTLYHWLFALLIVAGMAAAWWINDLATRLVHSYEPWAGALFLMAAVIGLRSLSMLYSWADDFEGVGGLASIMRTRVFDSTLGDLLLNVLLLLWLMIFFHREFEVKREPLRHRGMAFLLSLFNQAAVVAGIVVLIDLIQNLVFHSEIDFSLQNFLNIRVEGVLAIAAVMLMVFSLFLFSHRMMLTVLHIGLSKRERLVAMLGAVVVAFGIMSQFAHFHEIMVPAPVMMVICIIYITIFDFFLDDDSPGLPWLIGWLVVMAAFTAGLLYFFNHEKDKQLRVEYAKKLATFADPLLEADILELDEQLKAELRALPFLSLDSLARRFEQAWHAHFVLNKYLFNNYVYQTFAYSLRDSLPLSPSDAEGARLVLARLSDAVNAVPLERKPGKKDRKERDLYYWSDGRGHFAYLWVEKWPGLDAQGQPDTLLTIVEIARRRGKPSLVYAELLLQQAYKNLDRLDDYSWAIYQHGKLVDSGGDREFSAWLALQPPPPGTHRMEDPGDGLRYVVYQSNEDITVFIGRKEEGFKVFVSLFSYLFTVLVLITVLLAALNSAFHFLPPAIALVLPSLPPLRNRIQYSVIGLFLVSFLMIGFVTFSYFKESTEQYHENRLERKTTAAQTHAEHEIALLARLEGRVDLHQLPEPLAKVHRLDVNLYNTSGRLVSSSEKDIFDRGIVPPLINGHAWYALTVQGHKLAIYEEAIGKLRYKVAYVALRDPNERIVAYLGLPYYAHLREKNNEVASFMGALLNVYVLILIVATIMAVVVANSITKPLTDLGEGLRRLKLDGRNEPLRWSSRDELGELISEYNRMLFNLEEAKKKLARKEREGAWREMAKQIAHEIKNPLTPMKLSIQYLLRAYEMNPDQIGPMFKRVANTLIEQIDELNRIASEFSAFAKLPAPQREYFELNEQVASVHRLFVNQADNTSVHLHLADEPLCVFADKKHLMRVLNNIITNAIQAIPDDREGRVDVFVERKTDEPGRALIRIRDNGKGIPEELHERIFMPNFTTKSSGSGLGLAICRNLIQAMEGDIHFSSKEGQGTEFVIELPLVDEQTARKEMESQAG